MKTLAKKSFATLLIGIALTAICWAATLVTELVRIPDVNHSRILSVQKIEGRANLLTLEIFKDKTSLGRLDFFERQEVTALTEQLNMMAGKSFPHSRTSPDPSARWTLEPYNKGGVELVIGGPKPVAVKLNAEGAKTLSNNLTESLNVLKK